MLDTEVRLTEPGMAKRFCLGEMVLYMKKLTAFIGTLAVAGSLFTGTAQADTSTTSVAAAAPSVLDKFVLSYWAAYSGPSVGAPSAFTNDSNSHGTVGGPAGGAGAEVQFLDSTVTLGYKITDKLILAGNYRFILRPSDLGGPTDGTSGASSFAYRNKDPWINLIAPKLVHTNGLNIWADIRFYVPAISSAIEYGALRMTQISTYDVPKTRISLGLYTFERANLLTDSGASGNLENLDFDVSPFASYQMTSTLAATVWSDVVQATYANLGSGTGLGSLPTGWDNQSVDLSVGVGWDVTPKINLNPQFTFFPGYASLNYTTIGMIISAKVL
jgi:hypothetical protein